MVDKTIVATHSGSFHADDVMAFATLQLAFDFNLTLIRSRDPQDWAKATIVFDVGNGQFDHHMEPERKPRRDDGSFYSSAGLIWMAFGRHAIARVCNPLSPGFDVKMQEIIWEDIDNKLIRNIDAVDNGQVTKYDGPHMFAIEQVVDEFNPKWFENVDEDTRFLHAVDFVREILVNRIKHVLGRIMPEVTQEVLRAAQSSNDPRWFELPKYVPYQRVIFEHNLPTLYVLNQRDNVWLIHAVPPEEGSFSQRKPLPNAWAGLRDGQLEIVTGIEGANFCHPNLFIAGANSREAAIKMIEAALNNGG